MIQRSGRIWDACRAYRHLLRSYSTASRRHVVQLIRLANMLCDTRLTDHILVSADLRESRDRQYDYHWAESAGEALWGLISCQSAGHGINNAISVAERVGRTLFSGPCGALSDLFHHPAPRGSDEQRPDPRPGHYYVSAISPAGWARPERRFLVAGPYDLHATALSVVTDVRRHAESIDCHADSMYWGTARVDGDDLSVSILGVWWPKRRAVLVERGGD